MLTTSGHTLFKGGGFPSECVFAGAKIPVVPVPAMYVPTSGANVSTGVIPTVAEMASIPFFLVLDVRFCFFLR